MVVVVVGDDMRSGSEAVEEHEKHEEHEVVHVGFLIIFLIFWIFLIQRLRIRNRKKSSSYKY